MVSSRHLVQVIRAVGTAKSQTAGGQPLTGDPLSQKSRVVSVAGFPENCLVSRRSGADSIDVGELSMPSAKSFLLAVSDAPRTYRCVRMRAKAARR